MKIPFHILKKISNDDFLFNDSTFNKMSFDSYFIAISFIKRKTNENGTIHITKIKNHMYIYVEFKRNISNELQFATEYLKEYISSLKHVSKKINQNKLEVSILDKNIDFNKMKMNKKIEASLKYFFAYLLIFLFFVLITVYSLSFENHLFGFRVFFTSVLGFLSLYMVYRISNSPNEVFYRISVKLFIVFSLTACISLFSFLVF